jgi:hypothetical protein
LSKSHRAKDFSPLRVGKLFHGKSLAFGKTLKECEYELRSTLEDWLLVGLRLGHSIPALPGYAGYDLNKEPMNESVAAM